MMVLAAGLLDDEQGLAVLDRLAVLDQDLDDGAGELGLDLVHQLHGLDDAEGVTGLDGAADRDEGLGTGVGGPVERADHRRLDGLATAGSRWLGGCCGGGSLRGRHGGGGRLGGGLRRQVHDLGDRSRRSLDDAHAAFGFGDFEFGNAGLGNEVDQGFEFAQIHAGGPRKNDVWPSRPVYVG